MLRRTQTFLKVSPYFLFLQDLSKAGKLAGHQNPGKHAAKQYHKLSANEKASLVKRAGATTYSSNEAYKRMAKRELSRKDIPIAQRHAELKQKWAASKRTTKAAAKPKSAASKVKKAAKAAKPAKKATKKTSK